MPWLSLPVEFNSLIMRKNTLLLMSLINVLSSLALYAQSPSQQVIDATSQPLKILSWNIYMLPYISLFNGNGRRAEAIGKQLMDSDYQIVVFQEAFSSKCRKILYKKLIQKYPYHYGPANMPGFSFKTSSGLWIWSKIPLTELKEIRYKTSSGFDWVARKGAVLFEGNYNGAKFQLLATHLQANNSPEVRRTQISELAHLLDEYYTSAVPQIICGDFNTEKSDTQNYNNLLQTLGAQNGSLTGTLQVTYDQVNNNLARNPKGTTEVIDYILTRNAYLIDNMQRRVVEFYHEDSNYKTHLSDHYAMEAEVKFTPFRGRHLLANY